MKTWQYSMMGAALLALASCSSDTLGGNDGGVDDVTQIKSIELTAEQLKTADKLNRSGLDIWFKLGEQAPQSNHFFSPYGIHAVLTMVANGADGETLSKLTQFLYGSDSADALDNLNDLHKYLLTALPSVNPKGTLKIANSAWFANNFTPASEFIAAQQDVFGSSIYNFQPGSNEALEAINRWCRDKTDGLIPNYMSESPTSPFVLLNANYFAAQWERPFDKSKTDVATFHCASGKQTQVAMMHKRDFVSGTATEHFRSITRPMKGFAMLLILPEDGVGGFEYQEELMQHILFDNDMIQSWDADISLPRFELSSDYNFTSAFSRLGLFGETVNLSRLHPSWSSTMAPQCKQKSTLSIDEVGAKASSVTEASGIIAPTNERAEFVFDRPFYLAIIGGNTILYLGYVAEL